MDAPNRPYSVPVAKIFRAEDEDDAFKGRPCGSGYGVCILCDCNPFSVSVRGVRYKCREHSTGLRHQERVKAKLSENPAAIFKYEHGWFTDWQNERARTRIEEQREEKESEKENGSEDQGEDGLDLMDTDPQQHTYEPVPKEHNYNRDEANFRSEMHHTAAVEGE